MSKIPIKIAHYIADFESGLETVKNASKKKSKKKNRTQHYADLEFSRCFRCPFWRQK
jgi:hypothetical protein